MNKIDISFPCFKCLRFHVAHFFQECSDLSMINILSSSSYIMFLGWKKNLNFWSDLNHSVQKPPSGKKFYFTELFHTSDFGLSVVWRFGSAFNQLLGGETGLFGRVSIADTRVRPERCHASKHLSPVLFSCWRTDGCFWLVASGFRLRSRWARVLCSVRCCFFYCWFQ